MPDDLGDVADGLDVGGMGAPGEAQAQRVSLLGDVPAQLHALLAGAVTGPGEPEVRGAHAGGHHVVDEDALAGRVGLADMGAWMPSRRVSSNQT